MTDYTIARLRESELPAFRAFCETHWGARHPLIHNEAMFDYYFRRGETLNFLRASDASGDILSVAGFLYANGAPRPDVWLSYILTKKSAPLNLGFHMLEAVRGTTNCRTLGVNNIRPKTRGLYEFLGYETGRMHHYYRLNSERTDYTLCNILSRNILPVSEDGAEFSKIETKESLGRFAFEAYAEFRPYKDRGYVERRFFENPWNRYELYAAAEGGEPFALVVFRRFAHEGHSVLRLVDFIGDRERFGAVGPAVDRLLRERGADFADVYAYGLSEGALNAAGFVRRADGDENIVPDYLDPPLYENVDYWAVGEKDCGYVLFRADGDQDRPNLT